MFLKRGQEKQAHAAMEQLRSGDPAAMAEVVANT